MGVKPFSVGVRIEHLQADIDRALYGSWAGHPRLGPAAYQLSCRIGRRGCYSFCMCPGGQVVAAASEPASAVTNGMSRRARDGVNANAALCVNVDAGDFAGSHPLAGAAFQREIEQRAFRLAGGGAPVETVGHFLRTGGGEPGRVRPSYTGRTAFCSLEALFPAFVTQALRQGLRQFGRQIAGFDGPEAILTAPETRTSAPVRILRDAKTLESVSLGGLYPAGEGAGYAGGIMSAAADGIRVARAILSREDGI